MVDKGGDVVGHQPDVDWSIDISGAAVSLQVGGDDLVALRELG
jgi:predicted component of type VI protein secretion system